jgi:lysophospholipase L1-like esterase
MTKKKKEMKTNLMLLIITLSFLFIAIEFIFYLVPLVSDNFYAYDGIHPYIPHKKGYAVSPETEWITEIAINSEGFYDVEHSLQKEKQRIAFLGDSFTANFMVPLNETFFKKIEKKLGDKAETLSFGVSGTGTGAHLIYLNNHALKYDPDFVILMFTMNDVDDVSKTTEIDGNKLTVEPPYHQPPPLINQILGKSKFLTYMNLQIRKITAREARYPEFYDIYASNYSQESEKNWEITKLAILEIKKISEESNAEFMLVVIPFREEIYPEYFEKTIEQYPLLKNISVDFEKPHRILEDFAKENNFTIIDLSHSFKEKARAGEKLYYKIDAHWNSAGNEAVAEIIAGKLKESINERGNT